VTRSARSPARLCVWFVTLGLLAAGARVARPALGPRYGGELRIGIADLPAALDPAAPRSAGERLLAGLVHETLLGLDDEGRARPALGLSWSSAADGREWTIRLAAATFHDGTPVDSADAARALRRFLRADSVAGAHLARTLDGGLEFRRRATEALPGIATPDSGRLVLRFMAPLALPLATLASPAAAVVSARGAAAGPFAPTTPLTARGLSALAFGRHVRGRPLLDAVRVAAAAPDRGIADAGGLDVSAWGTPVGAADGTLLLVLDPAAPPLADARTRALVAASMDRAQLVRRFLAGAEAADVLLTPALLTAVPVRAAADPPRPDTPPALLDVRLTLRVGADVPASASQRVVAHLSALGAEVQALPMSAAAPRGKPAAGDVRLVLWYPEVAEAGLALEELSAMAGSTAEVDEALAAADGERNGDRRRALLARAEEALRGRQVLVPLARVPLRLGARAGVHGLRVTPSGVLLVEDAWIEP